MGWLPVSVASSADCCRQSMPWSTVPDMPFWGAYLEGVTTYSRVTTISLATLRAAHGRVGIARVGDVLKHPRPMADRVLCHSACWPGIKQRQASCMHHVTSELLSMHVLCNFHRECDTRLPVCQGALTSMSGPRCAHRTQGNEAWGWRGNRGHER